MKNIAIIGHFGGGKKFSDGQTVKTKELYKHLTNKNIANISIIDTNTLTKNILSLIILLKNTLKNNEKIILIVSSRGYKVLIPILIMLNKKYKRDIYDFVIGGNRHNHLKKNKFLRFCAVQCHIIYLESQTLVNEYNKINITNIEYLPNFKNLQIVNSSKISADQILPLKLCTFSRISKTKGIEDAIEAVKMANEKLGKTAFELDIFGIPDAAYKEDFERQQLNFPEYIKYAGLVDYKNSTEILKDYYLLIFPTYHAGEGFPGTIIDAFASGLPVIASDWNSNSEIIEEGITGQTFPVKDIEELSNILLFYKDNFEIVVEMKKNCLVEARKYMPEYALKSFIEKIK